MGGGYSTPPPSAAGSSGRVLQFGDAGDYSGQFLGAALNAARGPSNPSPLLLTVGTDLIDSFTATTGAE